jgi:hypothetical protein
MTEQANMVVGADGEEAEDTDPQHLYRKRIIQAARYFEPNKEQQNIFGNGKATEKICNLLVS